MSHTMANTVVSLHERRSGGELNGHHVTGLVMDVDLVLVPAPPAWLLDPRADFAAFVVPIPSRADQPVTAVTPRRLAVLDVEHRDRREPVLAYVETAEPIPYPPLDLGAGTDAAFQRALEAGGDYWQALIDVGAVPPGLRDGLPADLARQAGDAGILSAPDGHGPVARTTHTYSSMAELAAGCHRPRCWPNDGAKRQLFGD